MADLWHVWVETGDDVEYEDDPQFPLMRKFEADNDIVIECDYRGGGFD